VFDGNICANVNTVFGLLDKHSDKEVNMVGHEQTLKQEPDVYHDGFYTCVPGSDKCINMFRNCADE